MSWVYRLSLPIFPQVPSTYGPLLKGSNISPTVTFLTNSARPAFFASFFSIHQSLSGLPVVRTGRKREISSMTTETETETEIAEVLVQYIVVRRDLLSSWPLGTIITQGCHASVAAISLYSQDPHTISYCSPSNLDHMRKVTLEVQGEAELVSLSEKLKASDIAHKLWIEQPENIPTCLATKPHPKSLIAPHFRKLKLCK